MPRPPTAAGGIILAVFSLFNWSEPRVIYLLAGGLLYLGGNIFVTMVINVPLNNTLAAVDPNSAENDSVALAPGD